MRTAPALRAKPVDDTGRYTKVACLLHWAIAVLVLLGLALALYGSDLESEFGEALINLHKLVGLSVLVLTVWRIGWRVRHRPPSLPISTPNWQLWLAKTVHTGFYVLLIALPLSGWLLTSAFPERHPIMIGRLAQIPYLPVSPDMALAQTAYQVHEICGWLMIALVALHVGAALKHQFHDRDSVLARMDPRRAN
jgi:cytochrome b561